MKAAPATGRTDGTLSAAGVGAGDRLFGKAASISFAEIAGGA